MSLVDKEYLKVQGWPRVHKGPRLSKGVDLVGGGSS